MIPALVIAIGSLLLLDTPSLMIERGKHDEARSKLRRIRGVDNIDEEFSDLITASEAFKLVKHPWKRLFERKYRPYLSMVVLIPFFQQLTGFNAIMFYGPVLFNASLMSSVITRIVNVGATLVSIYGVDKWGMRFLFLVGGAIVACAIGAKFGIDGKPGDLPEWYAIVVVVFICTYVAGFAWSWGPLG
ncbi:Sugar carrier protein C [Morus notabilis]|uniref:Sugar carrier protein C n=1 Tax=Morus notabilis TaxID=981085 RepID=W9RGI2_9ROSA|nr:Sugar carrier protein C [Morus notabilis]